MGPFVRQNGIRQSGNAPQKHVKTIHSVLSLSSSFECMAAENTQSDQMQGKSRALNVVMIFSSDDQPDFGL